MPTKPLWTVRAARPADAARISEIYNEGIAENQATVLQTATRTPSDIIALMCRPRHYLYVAEWGGTILGWCSLTPDTDDVFYQGVGEARVYISRGSRFQGLGKLLLEQLLEAAAAHGMHKIVGRIAAGNQASRNLCRSLGFREVGVHEKHARVGERWIDVVLVERLVQPAAQGA